MKYLTVSSMALVGFCLACDRPAPPSAPPVDASTAAVEFCGHAVAPDATRVECNDRSLVSVEPLAALLNLETVILDHTHITDLEPIVACKRISKLSIRDTQVVDVSALHALPKLETLNASGAPIDIATVAALTQVAYLELSPSGDNLDALAGLDLYSLTIDSDTVTDITALSDKVFGLMTLELPQLQDISALASVKVSFLTLRAAQLVDVSPLLKIEGLERLELVTQANLEPLARCEYQTFEYLSLVVPTANVSEELRLDLLTCAEYFMFYEL
ncbi:hypothetical protein [Enhygromyxa salina]|uniref:hypothetical protein n=1 Tax=Enhygromyxa salina TaxID=215803 RepID=UPI00069632BA|nr:hypothetical protein [Enhygromyxa salina]